MSVSLVSVSLVSVSLVSVYLDTSVLLPYYRSEARSDAVEAFLRARSEPVSICDLTLVEVASALARWVRRGELSEADALRVERALDDDLDAGRFTVHALGSRHTQLARRSASKRSCSATDVPDRPAGRLDPSRDRAPQSTRQKAHSPPRITGTVVPSRFSPSISSASEPNMKSTWVRLWLKPSATNSSSGRLVPSTKVVS